mgnify:CR=1 FL=1
MRVSPKPVTLEAEQWFPDKSILGALPSNHRLGEGILPTVWGDVPLHSGDWVVTWPDGTQMVYANDIFESVFNRVNP